MLSLNRHGLTQNLPICWSKLMPERMQLGAISSGVYERQTVRPPKRPLVKSWGANPVR